MLTRKLRETPANSPKTLPTHARTVSAVAGSWSTDGAMFILEAAKRIPHFTALRRGAQVILGGLFVYAAITKLADPSTFATSVANFRLVPAAWVPWVAVWVPGIEAVAGGLLVVGRWPRSAALVITAMLMAFTAALSWVLGQGLDIECGCFGESGSVDLWSVVRNLGLATVSIGLVAVDHVRPTPPG